MTEVTPLSAEEFQPLITPAATIYGLAMARPPEVVIQRRELIAVHLDYPGFVAAGAFDGTGTRDPARLLGFCYGYRGAPGQWWHDVVSGAIGRAETRRWLHDSFEIAELHVDPAHHGRGIGGALLADVLSRCGAKHAVLSTPDTESPARQLYRSRGFVDLLVGFEFPGSREIYAVMGLDL
ncbi:MAG TPA: GNAT family N-acetyltransferase [Mycobacteriales bacterium]|nr:GNAT family N-acetyltransferase [Mycobacteriales bacterium]